MTAAGQPDAHHPDFEPYLCLAGLAHDRALVAWGGFFFHAHEGDDERPWQVVQGAALPDGSPRRETIGAGSAPYGRAVVDVLDEGGRVVASATTADANHAWVTGLAADTSYRYRVTVDGEEWAAGERRDWVAGTGGGGGVAPAGRGYDTRFRTHPAPDQAVPVAFAVLGDYGVGVRTPPSADRQRRVAEALERAATERELRAVLTTGDNIYLGRGGGDASGDDDADWFFTYYQPYRYLIARVPVYPSVGNHDSSDEEASDDRRQLSDNFYLDERFAAEMEEVRASVDPGLFYRFRLGAHVELVCVDTSLADALDQRHFFDHPKHVAFLEEAFPEAADGPPPWRIPFMHHPAYCAGPSHGGMPSLRDRLTPLLRRSGARLVLSGHEHNFQWSEVDGVHHLVTGAGGKLRTGRPQRFEEAHTVAWAAEEHLLLVEVDEARCVVRPVSGRDGGSDLRMEAPDGATVEGPIVIEGRR